MVANRASRDGFCEDGTCASPKSHPPDFEPKSLSYSSALADREQVTFFVTAERDLPARVRRFPLLKIQKFTMIEFSGPTTVGLADALPQR